MTLRANMEIIAFLSGEGPGSRRNFLASVGAGWGFGLANPPCAWGNGLSRAAGLPQSGAGVVATGSRGTRVSWTSAAVAGGGVRGHGR